MFRPTTARPLARRGTILLVVLALLALFAVIALSFALYAESEATAARIHREATARPADDAPNGADFVNMALRQMVYPIAPDSGEIVSPFYGYSFAETMYGYKWFDPRYNNLAAPNNTPANQAFALNTNLSPFAGTGKLAGLINVPGVGLTDRSQVINFSLFQDGQNGYVIDPSWQGPITTVNGQSVAQIRTQQAANSPNFYTFRPGDPFGSLQQSGNQYTPGPQANPFSNFNYTNIAAPYTYPDTKDLYLAVVDPTSGKVLQPSYHRTYLFNATANANLRLAPPGINGLPAATDDWLTNAGRLKILRPRPVDHMLNGTTEFPYPPPNPDGTYTGDVQNLPYHQGQQRNDSIWLFPGLPNGQTRKWRGKEYAALVAPLVLDLNGRVNLTVAGNAKGANNTHASDRGLHPGEINPTRVLQLADSGDATLTTPESTAALLSLLFGTNNFPTASGNAAVTGRYGANTGAPTNPPAHPLTNQFLAFNGYNPLTGQSRVPPPYSFVNLDGATQSATPATDRFSPAGTGGYYPFPTYQQTRFYYTSTSGNPPTTSVVLNEFNNHPAQYSPDYATTAGGTYGRKWDNADLRRLVARTAGKPEKCAQTDLGKVVPHGLIAGGAKPGTGGPRLATNNTGKPDPAKPINGPFLFSQSIPGSPPSNPSYNPDPYQYVLDPANTVRQLVTTHSSTIFRPEFSLTYTYTDANNAVQTTTTRLGPIDVNRSLPDYVVAGGSWSPDGLRYDAKGNLDGAKVAQLRAARIARQNFARDILNRLVMTVQTHFLSQGLPGIIANDADPTHLNPPTAPIRVQYFPYYGGYFVPLNPLGVQVLRLLAQVAVNVVDYVDPDDIATVFLWNPPFVGGNPPQMADPTADAWPGITAGQEGNNLVVGTELPRLALSEAYACVVNDKNDKFQGNKANLPVKAEFWVELQNPLPSDPGSQGTPLMSNAGAARLHYKAGVSPGTQSLGGSSFSPYRLLVVKAPAKTANYVSNYLLTNPDKVFGDLQNGDSGPDVKVLLGETGKDDYEFSPPDVQTKENPNFVNSDQLYQVLPAGGAQSGPQRGNQGYYVIGPSDDFPGQDVGATLRTPDQPANNNAPVQSMKVDLGTANEAIIQTWINSYCSVVLRRLANPYLPEQPNPTLNDPTRPYNPYVTVDVFDSIPVRDRVQFNDQGQHKGQGGGANGVDDGGSIGRDEVYASATTEVQTGAGGQPPPPNTFFSMNTNSQRYRPWLTHLDRQLVNAIELLTVSATSPSLLTYQFGTGTAPNYQFHRHIAGPLFAPGLMANPTSPNPATFQLGPVTNLAATPAMMREGFLVKALDFLATHSVVGTTPVGGREHGRINVNTAWHPAVFQALFDANGGSNYFTDAYVYDPSTQAASNRSVWYQLNRAPSATAAAGLRTRSDSFDVTASDTPFGKQVVNPATNLPESNTMAEGGRYTAVSATPTVPVFYNPDVFNNPAATGAIDPTHPAVVAEPLGKMWNSATTTSDQFLVLMTVGFFEVRGRDPTTDRPILGKELYKDVPGDLRQKYAAVIDRSALALDKTLGPSVQSSEQAWFTATTSDIPVGGGTTQANQPFPIQGSATVTVRAQFVPGTGNSTPSVLIPTLEGQTFPITAANNTAVPGPTPGTQLYQVTTNPLPQIRIGYGDSATNGGDGEWFEVVGIGPGTATGEATLNLLPRGTSAAKAGTTFGYQYHPSGSAVSNVILGNPGPQGSGFDAFQAGRYKSTVVPYLVQLSPGS